MVLPGRRGPSPPTSGLPTAKQWLAGLTTGHGPGAIRTEFEAWDVTALLPLPGGTSSALRQDDDCAALLRRLSETARSTSASSRRAAFDASARPGLLDDLLSGRPD